ncbi:unnamed protein product [Sphacelaria rigidula]
MVYREKIPSAAMQYGQIKGVAYFETFDRTTSAASNGLVASVACKLHRKLMYVDVDQTFIQSELETDIYLSLPRYLIR